LGPFTNSDKEFFLLISDRTSYTESIAEIGMATLVKRSGKPNPGLNGNKLSSPAYLINHHSISGFRLLYNPCSLLFAFNFIHIRKLSCIVAAKARGIGVFRIALRAFQLLDFSCLAGIRICFLGGL
jgi:hypothetical protein